MENYKQLTENIRQYVTGLFNNYGGEDLYYHNLEHTETVVKRSSEIGAEYPLTEKELFIISAGAYFHDTGQLTGSTMLHEDRSVGLMKDYFNTQAIEEEIIKKIERCIWATKLPQDPKSLLDEIICDADLYHLGTENFLKSDELLRKEMQTRNFSVDDWEENTLELLLAHSYFTPYCRELLDKGKEENIHLVRFLLKKK